MQSPSSNTGAAKSRACGNCSRAKAKCMTQFDDASQPCARCFRLKKECIVQPRVKRKKRAPNVAGTADLESKIESLVSLLSAAQVPQLGHAEPHTILVNPEANLQKGLFPNNFSNGSARENRLWQPQSMGSSLPDISKVANIHTPFSRTQTPAEIGFTENRIGTPVKSPEELLDIFRVQFTAQFPYAIISPDITAVELQDKRPWLYKMIMMAVSSHDRHQQIETGKLLIIELSTAMLTRGERSLDMLQALLIYTSWSQYFAEVLPPLQSSGIVQLVLALIYDLGLTKAFRFDEETNRLLVEARLHSGVSKMPGEIERSLDECRALLYAFYLSSTISTCIRKADGLPFSPYMGKICEMLQESAEYEADVILVACVRFQSIADSVYRTIPNRASNSGSHNAPIWMHTCQLQTELDGIFKSLSSDLQHNVSIKLSYHSVEILLIDTAILETRTMPTYNSRRIDLRWSSMMAGKSLLDTFLTLPSSTYHAIPIPLLSQLSFCLMNLFKLAFVEDPGWDLIHVRETMGLSSYFEHLASNLEQAGAAIDSAQHHSAKDSFPTLCGRGIVWVKRWYDSKVASGLDIVQPPERQSNGMMESLYDMPSQYTFDYMDEIYWQELMADFTSMPMR